MAATDRRTVNSPRIGIVLGAGGALGWAYHLGVVEGLRQGLHLELAHATRVVGTSAGAAIAASVLAGASSTEVLAAIDQPLTPDEEDEMRDARGQLRQHPVRTLRPQAPAMVRKGGFTGLLGLIPAGVLPTMTLRRFPIDRFDSWPAGLWVPAVRIGDGEVVVFGRDRTDVTVRDALEASSAVPGMFEPKDIDGSRFMDGAVASATHADLLESDSDTVIVSSPMTRPPAPGKRRGPVRRRAQRQLDREVAVLRSMGTKVVVLTPDQAVMTAADGYPRSNPGAGAATVAAASRQATRLIKEQLTARGR